MTVAELIYQLSRFAPTDTVVVSITETSHFVLKLESKTIEGFPDEVFNKQNHFRLCSITVYVNGDQDFYEFIKHEGE
jgi:hypothetical protein